MENYTYGIHVYIYLWKYFILFVNKCVMCLDQIHDHIFSLPVSLTTHLSPNVTCPPPPPLPSLPILTSLC